MRLSMKAFWNVWICVFGLYLQVAVLGASQNYTCTIGDTARLFFRRSDREHLEDFMKYRAWKENISFAVIEKGTLTAICSNHVLKPFCLAKVQFQVWNKTHLLLKIINTNYEDSGEYGVQHVFGGLEGNDKDTISLKIQAKPTDIISSHGKSTEHGKKTLEHSRTTARRATISSGVSLTLPIVVHLLSFSLLLLWASN